MLGICICKHSDSPVITACTSWNEVKKSLGSVDKPVVLNRASSGNNDNPFGRSECYGIYNMIFEVSGFMYWKYLYLEFLKLLFY